MITSIAGFTRDNCLELNFLMMIIQNEKKKQRLVVFTCAWGLVRCIDISFIRGQLPESTFQWTLKRIRFHMNSPGQSSKQPSCIICKSCLPKDSNDIFQVCRLLRLSCSIPKNKLAPCTRSTVQQSSGSAFELGKRLHANHQFSYCQLHYVGSISSDSSSIANTRRGNCVQSTTIGTEDTAEKVCWHCVDIIWFYCAPNLRVCNQTILNTLHWYCCLCEEYVLCLLFFHTQTSKISISEGYASIGISDACIFGTGLNAICTNTDVKKVCPLKASSCSKRSSALILNGDKTSARAVWVVVRFFREIPNWLFKSHESNSSVVYHTAGRWNRVRHPQKARNKYVNIIAW